MKLLRDCRLYTFVDTAYLQGRDPADVARQLCDGGSDLVQLRAKGASPGEVRRIAETLLPITEQSGVGLVINDYPQVALAVGAPVVHLGQEDFFDAGLTHAAEVVAATRQSAAIPANESMRRSAETPLRLGLSTHSPDQAERALRAEPDYLAIGPVFATPTKPGRPAVTLDYVRWAAGHVDIPWFAIGGITLQNLDDVLAAEATRICVVSAILNAPDIAKACRSFKDRLPSAAPR